MKKMFLSVLLGSLGVLAISCGEDEATLKNFVEYDNETYVLSLDDSYINDYGCQTYCNYDFHLYSKDLNVHVYIELLKFGGSTFEGGTFTQNGQDYFEDDYLIIGDTNHDPSTGTVTATETSDGVWALEFSYTTANGPYNGVFEGRLDMNDYSGGARLNEK